MAYPVRSVLQPALLAGQINGRLSHTLLDTTPGRAGGPAVRLVAPAARAWRALAATAATAGHTLKATSLADSYRSYAAQEAIFRERYTRTPLNGRPSVEWEGRRWWQRPGTAAAAVPGTSNHGWGLAVDCGEERDSDAGTEPLDDPTLRWLLANEERFGFSHELQSEPWHIRYWAGDRLPAAVLAFEEDDMDADTFRAHLAEALRDPGIRAHLRAIPLTYPVTPTQSLLAQHNEVAATVALIASKVDIDGAELDAIRAAAREGATAAADDLVTAVLDRLPGGNTLTKGDVEAAVRAVFADAGTA